MMAGVAASQLAARINEIIELAKLLDTGIPAQGNNPGVTGKELQTALGQANCDKIRAAAKVLGGNRKAKIDNPK